MTKRPKCDFCRGHNSEAVETREVDGEAYGICGICIRREESGYELYPIRSTLIHHPDGTPVVPLEESDLVKEDSGYPEPRFHNKAIDINESFLGVLQGIAEDTLSVRLSESVECLRDIEHVIEISQEEEHRAVLRGAQAQILRRWLRD